MDQTFLHRVKRRDRIARWFITIGGMGIIFSVILILLLIGQVTLPLFQEPKAEVFSKFPIAKGMGKEDVLAIGVDEYLELSYVLDREGTFTFFETTEGKVVERITAPGPEGTRLLAVESLPEHQYNLLWSDGTLTVEKVGFPLSFDQDGKRIIGMKLIRLAAFDSTQGVPKKSFARISSEGSRTRVDLFDGGRLILNQQVVTTDLFDNEEIEDFESELESIPGEEITSLVIDGEGTMLYAGTSQGSIFRWDLGEPGEPVVLERSRAFTDRRSVTSLALVFGDISLGVGDDKGRVSTWFPVKVEGANGKKLARIHDLEKHEGEVLSIIPSQRDKSLLSLDSLGRLHFDHMTSERHLLTLANLSPLRMANLSSRGNGVIALNDSGRLVLWKIHNPHPEVSFKTLFGRVWYESYDGPDYVWQSSSASDDFEPKFSLTPLIFGTLKGTLYAMVFAIPLAIFGAIYTSQFGNPNLRKWIKPTVEIMAAIPSVIIGFLAALWFAPILEESVVALFLSFMILPATLIVALLLWQNVRSIDRLKKVEMGYEFLALIPVLILGVAAAMSLGPVIEDLAFGGDFRMWLFTEAGSRYDPRNNIVIAFALGFAVIPIIFTIAEDSLSNVPTSLRAASLALGASRWQTVWRVVLPSASPGIFAGIMIGFGRAIGETMIVLMATGNTPIMDLSIFNGMRPLSSNIAVEIPEAPHGETLYRILFLSAVILFLFTFVLNTAAEIVRQRLRKKYGRF